MKKIVAACLIAVAPLALGASGQPSAAAAVEVVDQFVQGCFMHFPYPDTFAKWHAGPEFQPLSDADASAYLGGKAGKAWSVQLKDSRFVLTALGTTACNVFANDVDPAMTQNLVVGFLDYLKTQGLSYQPASATPVGAAAGLSTTNYAVSAEGQVLMNMTLTVAPPGSGQFQIALTAAKAQ